MKKKKIIVSSLITTCGSSLIIIGIIVLTCANDAMLAITDFSKMRDFDYSKAWNGDKIEPYNTKSLYDNADISLNEQQNNSGNMNILHSNKFIDYSLSKHSPVWWNDSEQNATRAHHDISFEALTGAPYVSAINPIFGIPSNYYGIDKYYDPNFAQPNNILNSDETYFNISTEPLLQRDFVASKSVSTQDNNIKFIDGFNYLTNGNALGISRRPFWNEFITNYSYPDVFIDWNRIPPVSVINISHKNGVKIYGTLSFNWDFYQSDRAKDISWIFQIDKNGNNIFAGLLFNICQTLNLDGIVLNLEMNQSLPINPIATSKDLATIYERFNYLAMSTNHENPKHLLIYTPGNAGSDLLKNLNDYELERDTALANNSYVVRDYRTTPNNTESYFQQHPEQYQNRFNIFNTFRDSYDKKNIIGRVDFRPYCQKHVDPDTNEKYNNLSKEYSDLFANKWKLNNHNESSLWTFFGGGIDSEKLLLNNTDWYNTKTTNPFEDIENNQIMQHYCEMKYLGHNKFLQETDHGIFSPASNLTEPESNYSYGVGNLVPEKTILCDKNSFKYGFKTNFSTGSGFMFVDNDGDISGSNEHPYPWSNNSLGDTLPTYLWEIRNYDNLSVSVQDKINGYYDWYMPYRKGNSIALGKKFDENVYRKDGIVESTALDSKILWNIMGTNYQSNNHNVGMTFKITDSDNTAITIDDLQNTWIPKLAISLDDGSVHEIEINDSLSLENDGWISFNKSLTQLNLSGKKISKIGLSINPVDKINSYKLNVGELTVDLTPPQISTSVPIFKDLQANWQIKRDTYNNYQVYSSLQNNIDEDQIDYFEYYASLPNGKIMRIGEHWQKGLLHGDDKTINYWLREVPKNATNIIIKTVNKFYPSLNCIQSWNI